MGFLYVAYYHLMMTQGLKHVDFLDNKFVYLHVVSMGLQFNKHSPDAQTKGLWSLKYLHMGSETIRHTQSYILAYHSKERLDDKI